MNKVLFVGFSPVQLELIRKFIAFRKLERDIIVVSEQQASDSATAYVVNGEDPSAPNRLALHLRVNPRRVLGVGSKAVLGVTEYAPGPFKPATIDRLVEMLRPAPATATATASPVAAAGKPRVVTFPSTGGVPHADVLVVDDSEIVRRTMVKKSRNLVSAPMSPRTATMPWRCC